MTTTKRTLAAALAFLLCACSEAPSDAPASDALPRDASTREAPADAKPNIDAQDSPSEAESGDAPKPTSNKNDTPSASKSESAEQPALEQDKPPQPRAPQSTGDRAAGLLRVVVPGKQRVETQREDSAPPPTPQDLDPTKAKLASIPELEPEDSEELLTLFGEIVVGDFVICLDISASMATRDSGAGSFEDENGNAIAQPTRMQIVKAECIKLIRQLTEDERFAIVTFGDQTHAYERLVYGTDSNKAAAIDMLSAIVPKGANAAHEALRACCEKYPAAGESDYSKLFFICDGLDSTPLADEDESDEVSKADEPDDASRILENFPMWFMSKRDQGCELVAIHFGSDTPASTFMETLATQNGGTYIHK